MLNLNSILVFISLEGLLVARRLILIYKGRWASKGSVRRDRGMDTNLNMPIILTLDNIYFMDIINKIGDH